MNNSEQSAPGKSGYSRRAFLKGSGAAAAATALAGGGVLAEEQKSTTVVSGLTKITLDVNGQKQQVEVEPRTTLLEALRYGLNLTGAKPISIDGSSGGSTVLVAGKPVSANSILVARVRRQADPDRRKPGRRKIDPVPAAFAHHDASQCGFCTPGFVMAVKVFLQKNPKATEAEIRAGLNGNLCRCGTYANIIPAVLDVVKGAGNGR